MKKDIEIFVERYNKVMDWNKDIRASFWDDCVSNPYGRSIGVTDYTKSYIEDKLSTEKIDEEGFDLENATLYAYDRCVDGRELNELQAFNNKTYGTSYFWLFPDETEEGYKKRKVENLIKDLDKKVAELNSKISDLEREQKGWKTLLKFIKQAK